MLELVKISKKERFTTPARFKNYEPKPININIENNSDFPIKQTKFYYTLPGVGKKKLKAIEK